MRSATLKLVSLVAIYLPKLSLSGHQSPLIPPSKLSGCKPFRAGALSFCWMGCEHGTLCLRLRDWFRDGHMAQRSLPGKDTWMSGEEHFFLLSWLLSCKDVNVGLWAAAFHAVSWELLGWRKLAHDRKLREGERWALVMLCEWWVKLSFWIPMFTG